jgi:hypothetical protein
MQLWGYFGSHEEIVRGTLGKAKEKRGRLVFPLRSSLSHSVYAGLMTRQLVRLRGIWVSTSHAVASRSIRECSITQWTMRIRTTSQVPMKGPTRSGNVYSLLDRYIFPLFRLTGALANQVAFFRVCQWGFHFPA